MAPSFNKQCRMVPAGWVGPVNAIDRSRILDALYGVLSDPQAFDTFVDELAGGFDTLVDDSGGTPAAPRLSELESHFEKAAVIFSRFAFAGSGGEKAEADDYFPLLRLDATGTVTFANPAARTHLEAEPGSPLSAIPFEGEGLQTALAFMQGTQPTGSACQFAFLPAAGKQQPRRIMLMMTAGPDAGQWTVQGVMLDWQEAVGGHFGRAFSLTNAETDILESIVRGLSLAEFADIRGRSLATVRTQAKSLLRKTEVRSQIELVRMFSAMSLALTGTADTSSSIDAAQLLATPSGRTIEFRCFGPEDGLPVLLIHGLVTGIEPPAGALDLLDRFSIRLIAPWRPGFSVTSAGPAKARDASQAASADMAALMDHLGIGKALFLARDSGLIHAAAAANALPGRCTGIVSVTSNLPWRFARQLEGIAKWQRMFAYSARYFPAALPVLARGAMELLHNGRLGQLLEGLYSTAPCDRAAIADPAVASALRAGFEATFRQGTKAYETDARLTALDWSESHLSALSVPVCLLHGGQDHVTLMRDVRELAALYPVLAVDEVEEAGQLLWFTHWPRVIDALRRMSGADAPNG